ncbi:MAG: hypothetical protein Q9181_005984 [Wetmoreana brouardii]
MAGIPGQMLACVVLPSMRRPVYIAPKMDFVSVADNVIELGITDLVIHPGFMLSLMKEDHMHARLPKMGSLRALVSVGGPVDEEICCQFLAFWEQEVKTIMRIRFAYGMTELGGGVMDWDLSKHGMLISIELRPEVEIKIMNLQSSEEVSNGKEGELWVRGPNVCRGYWRDETATKKVLLNDGWFKTEDIAIMSKDRVIHIIARKGDMLRLGGRLLSPLYVESALLKHPHINDAVVCGIEGDSSTTDCCRVRSQRIRAYINKKDRKALSESQVVDFLSQNYPELPLLDGGVVFVDKIPKTPVSRTFV